MLKFTHSLLASGLGAILAAVASCAVLAQAYPHKPVRLLVGFTGGSTSDVIGRVVAQKLGESLGQQVLVENRPGAGANIAAEIVAKSAPDGYTTLYANTGIAVAISAYEKLGYDVLRDLAPVGQAAASPHILVVNMSLPVQSVKDLIALVKAKPLALNVASTGSGNSDHFAYELFRSMTGAEMTHIVYKGGPQAMIDVMSGQVAAYFAGMAVASPLMRTGKAKALAVTSGKRSPLAPDIPTFRETGYTKHIAASFFGIYVPSGTPKPIVDKLNHTIVKLGSNPEFQKHHMIPRGLTPVFDTPEHFAKALESDRHDGLDAIKTSGLYPKVK